MLDANIVLSIPFSTDGLFYFPFLFLYREMSLLPLKVLVLFLSSDAASHKIKKKIDFNLDGDRRSDGEICPTSIKYHGGLRGAKVEGNGDAWLVVESVI